MKHWKRFAALGLGLTLAFGQTAYADMIIPPIPTLGIPQENTGNGTASAPGTGNAGTVSTPETGNSGTSSTPGTGNAGNGTASTPTTGSSGDKTASVTKEPEIQAEGAVLMDAATGQVLFGKNQDKQFFPASITKVMTALLVLERCNLNDKVTFSEAATTNLESGAVALGIVEGDQLTVEQSLYGLLLKSANEIGNGLAEHVAGSVSAFSDLMNAKAKELGCKNTNFKNPHGLNDSEHKTTPYDMALILRAALQNETFRKIDTTLTYDFPATKKNKARTITMGHKMMYSSDSRYYPGIIGGKTGYTSLAGNTLVTGAERDGVRLIAVVMKSKTTHYEDTKAMLDYGFANYEKLTGRQTSGPASSAGAAETTGTAETTGPASAGWFQDGTGRFYVKENGTCATEEWLTMDGLTYWFDNTGYMATGWREFKDGSFYYFYPADGHMAVNCWLQDVDWYYFGTDGKLLTNTVTPDGYTVNEYGIWVQ